MQGEGEGGGLGGVSRARCGQGWELPLAEKPVWHGCGGACVEVRVLHSVTPQRELVTACSSLPHAFLLNNASATLSGHLFLPVIVI